MSKKASRLSVLLVICILVALIDVINAKERKMRQFQAVNYEYEWYDYVMNPGDQVSGFTVNTYPSGTFTFTPQPPNEQTPTVIVSYTTNSSFVKAMWASDDSLGGFFYNTPKTTQYIFLSLSNNNEVHGEEIEYMYNQIQSAMLKLGFNQSTINAYNENFHFVSDLPSSPNSNVLLSILKQFPSKNQLALLSSLNSSRDEGAGNRIPIFHKFASSYVYDKAEMMIRNEHEINNDEQPNSLMNQKVIQRLDGFWPDDEGMTADSRIYGPFPLVQYLNPCSGGAQNFSGEVVIMSLNDTTGDGTCSMSLCERILKAEFYHASGIVIYNEEGMEFESLKCEAGIGYTLITYEAGNEIITTLQSSPLDITFFDEPALGILSMIDSNSAVQEAGNIANPALKYAAWLAQYYTFAQNMTSTLNEQSSLPSFLSVPIFQSQQMNGPENSTVTIPLTVQQIRSSQIIQIEMSLGCPGLRDSSCPIWDRTLELFMCCDMSTFNSTDGTCGVEIGRWITPFRRRVGRWLTDITPLAPLFTTPTCTFQVAINPAGGGVYDPWVPTVSLLFSSFNDAPQTTPQSTIVLFNGRDLVFDSQYNQNFPSLQFQPPPSTTKVQLIAVITGHGSDNNNCCEFCVTSHHFVFNNNTASEVVRTFYNAGTPEGCAHRVLSHGVVPNEFGTWLYGRDGWCDGNEITPWVTDVTDLLNLNGENNVQYYGLYKNQNPNPTSSPGYIVLYSYLTFYSN